jgi:hypothetical protein
VAVRGSEARQLVEYTFQGRSASDPDRHRCIDFSGASANPQTQSALPQDFQDAERAPLAGSRSGPDERIEPAGELSAIGYLKKKVSHEHQDTPASSDF